ncbi:MAG: HAMP domain-containing protein [Chloroflexi bacterium]|nr:HAMP domain-containing protein [Chloroflexota bacterium]
MKKKREFLQSWNAKIVLFGILTAFLPLLALGSISYFSAQTSLQDAYTQQVQGKSDIINQDVNTWLEEQVTYVRLLASNAALQTLSEGQYVPILEEALATNPNLDFLIVISLEGKELYNSANTGGAANLQDLSDRPYFLAAKAGDIFINDPVVSRTTGNAVFVISAPIIKDGQIIAVLAAPIRVETVNRMIASAYQGETGEAYIINSKGVFLTPSRFAEELKASGVEKWDVLQLSTDSLAAQRAIAGDSGVEVYPNYLGQQVLGAFSPLQIRNAKWALIIEQETGEIYQPITRLRNLSILLTLGFLTIVIAVSLFISRRMTRPIVAISQATQRLAQGDLNQQITLRGKDEIGSMAEAFRQLIEYLNEMAQTAGAIAQGDLTAEIAPRGAQDQLGQAFQRMIANLRGQISALASSASGLEAASGELSHVSFQAGQATGQIAATIQQVARGTSQQSESVAQTATSVDLMARTIGKVARGAQEQAQAAAVASEVTSQISRTIEQVSGNAQAVTQQASIAASAASDGQQQVEQTIQGMLTIRSSVEQSAQAIEEMGRRSDQIGMIVETIEDIASQTNLLALNAAIEAARAGEHGKGFAVVADEVRKLAERSAAATREISALIAGIQSTVLQAVQAMRQSGQQVAQGVDQANASGQALNAILDAVHAVTQQAEQANQAARQMSAASNELVSAVDSVSSVIEANTTATQDMSASSTQVSQAIENIAAVSEENSAAVEEVSASTEEMSAQVQEVSAAAQSLAGLAEQLNQIVQQFRV